MEKRPENSPVENSPTKSDLAKLANFLDSKFQGPFGIRFGWDGIIGIIPGFGDAMTSMLSLYILIGAGARGAPPSALLHMGLNIFWDKLIGAIPFLGWIGDFAFKSNLKNIRLLQDYEANPRGTEKSSRLVVFGVIAFVCIAMLGVMVLALLLAKWAWEFGKDALA